MGTALVLLVPLLAMLVTDEVAWDWFDFAVMGGLLVGAGVLFEFTSKIIDKKYRPVIMVVFITAVVLIWAELAVGIFGSPIAGS